MLGVLWDGVVIVMVLDNPHVFGSAATISGCLASEASLRTAVWLLGFPLQIAHEDCIWQLWLVDPAPGLAIPASLGLCCPPPPHLSLAPLLNRSIPLSL